LHLRKIVARKHLKFKSYAEGQKAKTQIFQWVISEKRVLNYVRTPNYLDLISYLGICKVISIKRSFLILKG
jgi:hypothetical protein